MVTKDVSKQFNPEAELTKRTRSLALIVHTIAVVEVCRPHRIPLLFLVQLVKKSLTVLSLRPLQVLPLSG